MWESAALWGIMALVAYGLLSAAATLVEGFRSLDRPPGVAYILLVQNQADRVEGVVRSLAAEEAELLLVDLGSDDESPAIMERLVRRLGRALYFRFGATERSEAVEAAMQAATAPLVVVVDLQQSVTEKGKT